MENSNFLLFNTTTFNTTTTSSSVLASAENSHITTDIEALAGKRYPSSFEDQSIEQDDWHTSFDEECSNVLILGHKEIETLLAVDPKKSKKENKLNMQYVSGMHERWLKPMEAEIKCIKTLVAKIPAVDGAYSYLFPVWPCHEVKDLTVKATRIKKKGVNSRSRFVTITAQQQEQTCAILARKMAQKGWFSYFHQKGMDKRLSYCFTMLGKGQLLCPYSKEMNARELSVVERLCYRHSFFKVFPEMKDYFKLTDAEGLENPWTQAAIMCASLGSSYLAVTAPAYGIPLLVTGATAAALALFNSKAGQTVTKTSKMLPNISFCVNIIATIRDKVSQMVSGLTQYLWGGLAVLGSITVTAIVSYFCYRLVAARAISQEAIMQTAAVYGEANYPMPIVVEEKDSSIMPLVIAGLMTGISAHTILSKYTVLRRMALDFTNLSTFPIKRFINFICSCVGLEPVFDLLDYMQEYSVLRARIQSMIAEGAAVGDLLNAKADVRTFILNLAKCKNPSHTVVRGAGDLWDMICKEVRNRKVALPSERIEPVVVAFFDKRCGTGKSTSCARLHEMIHLRKQKAGQFRDRDAATTKYMRTSEAFWSGVQPDAIAVVYEELCSSTLPNVNVVRAAELLDLIGTAPFSVPMADVESKGKMHLSPEYVYITSNNDKHTNSGMISDKALIRRIDFPLVSTIVENPKRDDHLDYLYEYHLASWYTQLTDIRVKMAWHELREGQSYTFTEIVKMMERCSYAKKQRNQNYSASIDYTGKIVKHRVLDVSPKQQAFVAVPKSVKDSDHIIINQQTKTWKALRREMSVLGLVEDSKGNEYFTIDEQFLPEVSKPITFTGPSLLEVSNPQLKVMDYTKIHCGDDELNLVDGVWVLGTRGRKPDPQNDDRDDESQADDEHDSNSEEDNSCRVGPMVKSLKKGPKHKEVPERILSSSDEEDSEESERALSIGEARVGVPVISYQGNQTMCLDESPLTQHRWDIDELNMYATDECLVIELDSTQVLLNSSYDLDRLCIRLVRKMRKQDWTLDSLCDFNDRILRPLRFACAGITPRVPNLDMLQQAYDELADNERAILGLPMLATGYRKLRETLHHVSLMIRIAYMGRDPALMRELQTAEPNFLASVNKYLADHTFFRLVAVAGSLVMMCTLAAAGFKVLRNMIGNESITDMTEGQLYHKFNYELKNPITGHYYTKPKNTVTTAESKFPEMLNPGVDPSQAHLRHMQMKCGKALANTKMVRVYSKSYNTAVYTWIMFANSTCGFAVGHVFSDLHITGVALVADKECNGINFNIDQLRVENVSGGASDVYRITFPQCVQNVKKLDHLFLPKADYPARVAAMRGQLLTDGKTMVPVYTNTYITKPSSRETNSTFANGKVLQFSDWYRSSALGTSAGDCGIPYASQNNILGIHCAACSQYTVMAPIYREWVIPHEVSIKSRKELEGIVTVGQMCAPRGTYPVAKLDRKFNVGMKNVIGVSKMAIGKSCPLKAKPVVLDEDLSMCYKYDNPDPAIPRYLFNMILGPGDELVSQNDWNLPRRKMKILTLRQAVFGDPELGVESLDATTSVGPVLKDIKKKWSNRSQIFDMEAKTINPEFERLCNDEWNMMERKEMYPPLFRDCKKMELRAKDYARIFNIGDLVSLVNWKRAIGHLLSHRCAYNSLGRSAFGMNPYSFEYAIHVNDLQKCKYAWGEDFKGYDMSTPWFMPHLSFKWYQSWYHLREDSPEYNVALCLVKYSTTNAQHICHRTLYAVTGCNTSGQYVTGAKNDTDNVCTHYIVFIHIGVMTFGLGNFPEWYNFSHVYIKTMGDDVVIGILNDKFADKIFKLFNRVTIARWMNELFGMTVTPAVKDQELTPCDKDWKTIPFCKRLPVKIQGYWFGRLDKDSIQGMLYYSKDVRKECIIDMESRIRSAAIETAIWGPEEYSAFEDEWKHRAIACGCNWSQCAGSYRERIGQLVSGYTTR